MRGAQDIVSEPSIWRPLRDHLVAGGRAVADVHLVPDVRQADAQVHVVYDVLCYKASRAAVSGGNPILGCRISAIIENGYINGETIRIDGALRMAPK